MARRQRALNELRDQLLVAMGDPPADTEGLPGGDAHAGVTVYEQLLAAALNSDNPGSVGGGGEGCPMQ